MLDSGWDKRCCCQIRGELKLWHASSPLGIACTTVRWKKWSERRKRVRRTAAGRHKSPNHYLINRNVLKQPFALVQVLLCSSTTFNHSSSRCRCQTTREATWQSTGKHQNMGSLCACALTALLSTSARVCAQVCRRLKSLDRRADALFLSSGSKHQQHYQRPQLALLSIKSPLS